MTFEEQLRSDMQALPVIDVTDHKRQLVLERIHAKQTQLHIRRLFHPVFGAATIAALLVITLAGIAFYHSTLSQPASTAASRGALQDTVLNTSGFRSVVQTYLQTHTWKGMTHTDGSPAMIERLTVRWSQVDGKYGYAFVSYRIDDADYFTGVVAIQGTNHQWSVFELFNGYPPLSKINPKQFPIYNGEAGGSISGNAVGPTYFMICGVVMNPAITRIQITWHDGRMTELPVANGVYGYVQIYPSTQHSVPGPHKIGAYTTDGSLVYSQ